MIPGSQFEDYGEMAGYEEADKMGETQTMMDGIETSN